MSRASDDRRTLWLGLALVVVALALVRVFTLSADSKPTPVWIEATAGTAYRLTLACAHDITATVAETSTEVRITEIDGRDDPDNDCLASYEFVLARPIGGRSVIVDGAIWLKMQPGCPHQYQAPSVQLPVCKPVTDGN